MSHAPGEWKISRYSSTTVESEGRTVASCGGYQSNVNREAIQLENEANSRLIAAAPDLLSVLQGMVEYHYPPNVQELNVNDRIKELHRLAIAAISKAAGKS